MLLLLTGMETDLSLVNRMRKTAFFASLSGIVFPFTCGFLVGQYMPEGLLPHPSLRLATSLFLATALSISSVKIVAMVIMEVGFLRRNVGQIILASAILDDTIGWIIIAVIGSLASGGGVNLRATSVAFLGTVAFLAVSFTLGRRAVAYVIRWTNDNLTIEMPVITAILVLMLLAALVTDYIGVHTVLGAFVVGILVGQSPILTRHIEEELRGLIVALFAPVFFALAGREIDLTILKSLYLLKLALVFIVIASFGKIAGCYLGGRVGGMGRRESTALAIGMNARGSTEVIVATIGLSLGVLSRDLFTLIVVMAIATTLVTPPLLRWALRRIPATGEEKERLEREAAEAKAFVPKIERLLIAVDGSADGRLASTLAGLFAGTRQILTTVLELGRDLGPRTLLPADKSVDLVKASAEQAARSQQQAGAGGTATATAPALLVNKIPLAEAAAAITKELEKGYEMLFLGVARALESKDGQGGGYAASLAEVIREFEGASAVAVARGERPDEALRQGMPVTVLVPRADVNQGS
jgi:Kef-type K+ transport system membrane component KefB